MCLLAHFFFFFCLTFPEMTSRIPELLRQLMELPLLVQELHELILANAKTDKKVFTKVQIKEQKRGAGAR